MMPDLGKYAFAVLGSYAAAGLLIGGLIALTAWQRAKGKRALAEAEARAAAAAAAASDRQERM